MSGGLQLRPLALPDLSAVLGIDAPLVHAELFGSPTLKTYCLHSQRCSVDLWCCRTQDVAASALSEPQQTMLLSDHEHNRAAKFRSNAHRCAYLTTRFLVRVVLSHYADLSPTEWRFERNRFGRPAVSSSLQSEVRWRAGTAPVDFNLSRSGELVLCAVTPSGRVGVDVEDEGRLPDVTELAPSVLASGELYEWERVPEQERSRTFLRYWVLKEAYVKARGVGLTLAPNTICFQNVTTSEPKLCRDSTPGAMEGDWKFGVLHLFNRYRVGWAHVAVSGQPTSS